MDNLGIWDIKLMKDIARVFQDLYVPRDIEKYVINKLLKMKLIREYKSQHSYSFYRLTPAGFEVIKTCR